MDKLRVVELFAGVGGFRIGLEGFNGKSSSSEYKKKLNSKFQVIWSNQWEPSTKIQHASLVYEAQFGSEGHSNEDISTVPTKEIPNHDILVGGFPCQDYSVATTLKNSGGLEGKKGVLWWEIYRILKEKGKNKPKYLFLENVDRLIKSPASQRGRDFAIMLSSLNKLGYAVEWRVINAADYGMSQRRRRIFIIGYRTGTSQYKKLKNRKKLDSWLETDGVLPQTFKGQVENVSSGIISNNLVELTAKFNVGGKTSLFKNAGVFVNGKFITSSFKPIHNDSHLTLGDIVENFDREKHSPFILNGSFKKWKEHKGSKSKIKTNKEGITYKYSEGSMQFPDLLTRPSRTIITGEGGAGPSRFKHVIIQKNPKGKEVFRRLTPVELERLNMFPDNHTKLEGISDARRAFFMGNALVVGVVEKIGKTLQEQIVIPKK